MTDELIPLHCPKCGECIKQTASELDLDKPFNCGKCGASVYIGELKTPSGKTLLEDGADRLRDALKGIKGFKP